MKKKIISSILSGLILSSILIGSNNKVVNANAPPTGYKTLTRTITYDSSTARTQNQSINIPYLKNVKSITTNTGNVSYSVSGNTINMTLSNGNADSSYTPSTSASSYSDQYLNNNFSDTKWYNDGSYSGNLYKNGGSYVISGNTPDSRTEYAYRESWSNNLPNPVWYDSGGYSGNLWGQGVWTESVQTGGSYTPKTYLDDYRTGYFHWQTRDNVANFWSGAQNTAPSTYPNDWFGGSTKYGNPSKPSDFYGRTDSRTNWEITSYWWAVGTNNLGTSTNIWGGIYWDVNYSDYMRMAGVTYRHFNPASDTRTWGTMWKQNYSGTVSRPDTRTYRQNYSGTVYGSTTYYYRYTVTINYEADPNATLTLNNPTNSNNIVNLTWDVNQSDNVDTLLTSSSFDGVSNYINKGTKNYVFDSGFKVEFTARWNSLNSWSRIIDFANGASNDNIFIANMGTTNNLYVGIYRQGETREFSIDNVITVGETANWLVDVDANGYCKVYKNNNLVGERQLWLPNNIARTNTYIGRSNYVADGYFNGTISNLKITTKAQSYRYYVYRNNTLIGGDFQNKTYNDYSASDLANPSTPNVTISRQGTKITANITSNDNGTGYNYYIVGYGNTYGNTITSNTVSTNTNSGIMENLYKLSTSSNDMINGNNLIPYKNALVHYDNNWQVFNYSGYGSSFSTNNNGYNGLNYGRLTGSGMGDSGVILYLSGLSKNTEYKASAMVRYPSGYTDGGNGTLFIVNKYDSVGIKNVFANKSSTSWQKVELTFNSGDNDAIHVRLNRGNASELQFTDIRVEATDNYNSIGSTLSQIVNDNNTYYLYTKSKDKNNNLSSISKVSINIPSIKPTLTATSGNNFNTINWSINDNTQTYLYDLYRNGTRIASNLSSTSYNDYAPDTNKPNPILNVSDSQVMDYTLDYNKHNFSISPTIDTGTTYSYYVVAKGQVDNKNITSNTDTATITSGIKGYYYIIDNNPSTILNTSNINTTNTNFTVDKLTEGRLYIHVIAVDNQNNYSNTYTKQFNVLELMQIRNLQITNHINKPNSLNLPYNLPSTPADIKTGFNISFNVDTTNIDNLNIEFYLNGSRIPVYQQLSPINNLNLTTGNRNSKTNTFTVWFDKYITKNSIIDIKFKGTKNRSDGTRKDFIEDTIGDNAMQVVGSSLLDVYTNSTN